MAKEVKTSKLLDATCRRTVFTDLQQVRTHVWRLLSHMRKQRNVQQAVALEL